MFGNILVRLVKFERNFTKHNFYFVTQFISKRNFNFETEGVYVSIQIVEEIHTCLNKCNHIVL
jgi:hypothetical protein